MLFSYTLLILVIAAGSYIGYLIFTDPMMNRQETVERILKNKKITSKQSKRFLSYWVDNQYYQSLIDTHYLDKEHNLHKQEYDAGMRLWMEKSTDEEKKKEKMHYNEEEGSWTIRTYTRDHPDDVWKPKHTIAYLK